MSYFLYLIILTGYIFSRGFFATGSVSVLLCATLLYILYFLRNGAFRKEFISREQLLVVLCLFSIVVYGGLYQGNSWLVYLSYFLLMLNFILGLLLIGKSTFIPAKRIVIFMLVIALSVRLFMIWSSPDPYIDVYDYLKNGALAFVSGQNPYTVNYARYYQNVIPDYYSYLPGMVYLTLPIVLIFHDPRYTFILAEFLAAYFIFKMTEKSKSSYIYPLLFLANPISPYMIEQSYTEPLILCLLLLFGWLSLKPKNILSATVFGLVLSTKQYALFLLPLFLKLIGNFRKTIPMIIGVFTTIILIVAPFFFWNPSDFWHDAISLQLTFGPRYEGLTFFSLLYRFGFGYSVYLSLLIICLFLIFIYRRKVNNLAAFFSLSSFVFFALFFFNKWAFMNYYYLISQLFLAGAVLRENEI